MASFKKEPKKKLNLKKSRIRAFFLSIETKKKEKKDEIDKASDELYQDGMVYLQMKLPVKKITKDFEDKLEEKIHNVVQATIREATKSDLDTLKNIYNRSWLTSNTPFRPIRKTDLLKFLDDPDTVFLIARVYGIDAAFVLLDFEGPNHEYAIIAALAVLPRFQRKGVGTALGMASWRYFKEKYSFVKELRCEVYQSNIISYSFIRGIGFKEYERKVYKKEDFEIIEDK